MTAPTDDIRTAVRDAYGSRAQEVLDGTAKNNGLAARLYDDASDLPESLVSYGCGNPIAIAGLQPGETVLDLGAGAGLDCFLSARQVGPTGRVIGVDMTDEMIALAERNRAEVGADNVEFRKGLIEDIPVDDASVDVIISNCVINLSTDKPAVLHESFRVLRPGGRFQVSDIVLVRGLSEAEQGDLESWAGCKAGALHRDEFAAMLGAAGFEDVEIAVAGEADPGAGNPWRSALINARRPGGPDAGKPWQHPDADRIATLPMASTSDGACCAGDCC